MRIVLLLVGLLLSSGAAVAKNLYVNNSGNPTCSDSTTYANNGSSNPWCTLGRALWGSASRSTPNSGQAATAGDTVIVSAGTYTAPDTGQRFGIAFQPVNQGTGENSRIIIQASGTVNLRTTGTLGGPVIGANASDYITWDGFTIDETTYTSFESGEQSMVMFVNSANYGTVKNCTLIGTTTTGDNLNHAGIFYHDVTNGYVYNNTIYNVYGNTVGDTNTSAIYSYGLNTGVIEHNHIYNSRGGIFMKEHGNSNITIRNNKLHGIQLFGIRSAVSDGENSNFRINNNLIYDSEDAYAFMFGYMQGPGNIIANNTAYDVRAGFHITGVTFENNDVLWHNNIVHTAGISAIYTWDYSITQPTDHLFEHNSYYGIPANCHWNRDGQTCNTWTTWTATWGQDRVSPQGTNGVDPLFVNSATGDFRLQVSSPARTLGVDILDLDGDGSTTDIIPAGAYVTGNEIIGTVSGLAAPSGFEIITQ
jgi:hypothetical protein